MYPSNPSVQSQSPSQVNAPVDFSVFAQHSATMIGRWILVPINVLLFLLMFIGMGVAVYFFGAESTTALVIGVIWVLLILAGMMASSVAYHTIRERKQEKVVQQFAERNGWQTDKMDAKDSVATALLGSWDGERISAALKGTYKNVPFKAVHYTFYVGEGDAASQENNFVNLCFTLPHVFPFVVLDDKRDNYFMGRSSLPGRVGGVKTLSLEGNFDNRFQTMTLAGSERDVLHLLTPNFMAALMDTPARADIELQGNKLFIIKRAASLADGQALKELFAMADVALYYIQRASDTWQASSSQEAVAAMAQTAVQPREQYVDKTAFSPMIKIWAGVGCLMLLTVISFALYDTLAIVLVIVTAVAFIGASILERLKILK